MAIKEKMTLRRNSRPERESMALDENDCAELALEMFSDPRGNSKF